MKPLLNSRTLSATALLAALVLGSCQSPADSGDKTPVIKATSLKIAFAPDEIAGIGNTAAIDTLLEPSNVSSRKVVWTSSAPSVATVTQSGAQKTKVTAVSAGTAVITGTLDGLSSSTTVTVTPGGTVSRFVSTGSTFIMGVAVDSSGNVFYSANDSRIYKVEPGQLPAVFAGSSAGYAEGTGTAAQFKQPYALAFSADGNTLYVADTGNNRIRKVTNPGAVVTLLAGSGTAGSADNATGTSAEFDSPLALAVDSDGTVFVTGSGHRIRKIDATTGAVTTFAGSATAGFDNGTTSTATFSGPGGLALDSSHNLYVADTGNNAIRKITQTLVVTTLAGSGTEGYASGTGAAALFKTPRSLTIDSSGNLYVNDDGNYLIRKIDPSGKVSTVAGQPHWFGSTDGLGSVAQFTDVWQIAFGGSGTLFVADNININNVADMGIRKIVLR